MLARVVVCGGMLASEICRSLGVDAAIWPAASAM